MRIVLDWRNVPVTLSGIAFHEKADRSQVFFSAEFATTVAILPSALFGERLVSLGASWAFSFQPVLPPDCNN